MADSFKVESSVEPREGDGKRYPTELKKSEYVRLERAVGVIDALWYIEESYDVLLQNGIEFQTAVARIESQQRANISSFPDETDIELRHLNRLLINFLASCRAFVDSTAHRVSDQDETKARFPELKAFISETFDSDFSYRFMDALRNHTQHRAAPIGQTLTTLRTLRTSNGDPIKVLSVLPQIERDRLVRDGKVRRATRDEIAGGEEMIEVLPHVSGYLKSFERIVTRLRELVDPAYRDAVLAHHEMLKDHLSDEWSFVWIGPVVPHGNAYPLFTGAHALRRLDRIRLRNSACDPKT